MKGWRTVLWNLGIIGLMVLTELVAFLAGFDWGSILPPQYVPYAILSVATLNIVLRALSTTRLGERPRPNDGEITQ
jgi:ABC-type uncharacterized transport system permease subunit